MIPPPLHIGIPHAQTHELLRQNFSSASYYPKKGKQGDLLTLSYLIDRLNGLIKLPFIIEEGRLVQYAVRQGETLWTSSELRFQSLSLVANVTEYLTWLGEREYISLYKRDFRILDAACSFARMILYGRATAKEALTLHALRKNKIYVYNSEKKRQAYQFHRLQLFSHLTYLTCMTFTVVGFALGLNFPRKTIRVLHFASFIFGLISMQYDQVPFFPSGNQLRLLTFRGLYAN